MACASYQQAHPHGDSLAHRLGVALHCPGTGAAILAQSRLRATLQTACFPEASWASWHCWGATKCELHMAGCILCPTVILSRAPQPSKSVRPQGHRWPRPIFSWPHSSAFRVSDSTWHRGPKAGASRRREDGRRRPQDPELDPHQVAEHNTLYFGSL